MALPEAVRLRREPTVAGFEEQRLALKSDGHAAVERVQELSREQVDLGQTLSRDLAGLSERGKAIEGLQASESAGVLAALVRRFTARNYALARRSATAALVTQFEAVQTALRRATALADDLRVCSVELQASVDSLHDSRNEALRDGEAVARRVLALEAVLDEADDDQLRDRAGFELRQESTRLSLLEGMAQMCADQLPPARALRDTVQRLHAETAQYVLNAAGTVNEAGRSVQALGVAADAPVVVHELKEALARLEDTMSGTEGVVELAQHLVTTVLPDLDAQLSAVDETRRLVATTEHGTLDRAASRAQAERALRLAAEAEVEALGS